MKDRELDVPKLVHDLRNPLAAIYTAASVIEELPPDTPISAIQRHLTLILSAVEQGRDLLERADRVIGPGESLSD